MHSQAFVWRGFKQCVCGLRSPQACRCGVCSVLCLADNGVPFSLCPMVKRKAEGSQGGGKAPARPTRQPPPPAQDDSDSDVCEIISPPPSSNPPGRRPHRQPSPVAFSAAPGANHPFLPPQGQAVGFLSMMSGMPGGFQLPRPGQGAGFGLGLGIQQQQTFAQRMQAPGGLNPLLYAPRQHLPPAAGFHGGGFAGSSMSLAAGASSGGASSEARQSREFSLAVFENGRPTCSEHLLLV